MESQETKIRRGQAFNLAVNDSIAKGESGNPKYIYRQFIYYYNLADIVQGSDLDMIQQVLNNPDFDKAIKQLQTVFAKQ
jgi:hypothetical protein